MITPADAVGTIGPTLSTYFRKKILKEYIEKNENKTDLGKNLGNVIINLLAGFVAVELNNLSDLSGLEIQTLQKILFNNIDEGIKTVILSKCQDEVTTIM